MGSFDSEDGRKARNSMPAKLNGRGGSETELSASRASTPKSARSERTSKIPVKNGLSKPNSRASTPKSTQGDRPKSAARNGASKPGSRQSTPKPQSRAQPPAELPFSGFKSSPKEPLLMPRSSSKGSTAGARPKNVSTPKAQTASEVLPSEDALSETPSAVDSNPSKDPKPQSSKENSSTGRPRKPASRSRGVSKVQSTPQNPSVSKPKSTKSLRVQELANDASEPTTPTSEPDLTHSANSTPSEKTNRTRRRADKQASKPINLVAEIPGYSSAEDIATPVQDTPLSGVEDSAEPNKRPLRGTRSTRRGAKVSASAVEDKPLDSPAVSEPQDIEMADAPIPNSEGVSFGDDSEMGGLNGIDSNAEAPVSPTSSSARASGRVRKPTTKAIESAASSAKRARRNGMAQPAAPKTAKRTRTRKGRAPRKKAPSAQAKRMFDIASAAVCSGYVPREDAATILADLRREFEQKAKEREAQARAKSVAGDDKNENPTNQDEYFVVPAELQLFRPANTYGDSQLPQPPMRLRSREQAEKDRVYGYPPRLGQRNLPRNTCPFEIEDLSGSVSFSRLQQLAQQRKIEVDDSMTSEKVRELIQEHDADYFRRRSGHPPLKLRIGNHSSQKLPASPASSETSRKRRRQEPEAEAEEGGQKSDSKKRRKSETNTEEDGSASKLQRIRLVLNKSRKNDPNRKG